MNEVILLSAVALIPLALYGCVRAARFIFELVRLRLRLHRALQALEARISGYRRRWAELYREVSGCLLSLGPEGTRAIAEVERELFRLEEILKLGGQALNSGIPSIRSCLPVVERAAGCLPAWVDERALGLAGPGSGFSGRLDSLLAVIAKGLEKGRANKAALKMLAQPYYC